MCVHVFGQEIYHNIFYDQLHYIYIKNQNEGIILRSTGCPFDNFSISKPMLLAAQAGSLQPRIPGLASYG